MVPEEQLFKGDYQQSSGGCDGVGALLEGEGYLLHHCWDLGVVVLGDWSVAAEIVRIGHVLLKLPFLNHDLGLCLVNGDNDYNLYLSPRVREPPFHVDVEVRQRLGQTNLQN